MTKGAAIASLVTLLGCGPPTPSPTPTYPHVAHDYDGDGSTSDVDCNDAVAAMNWRDEDGDGQATCAGDCDDFEPVLNTLDEDGDGADTCTWRPDCDDHDPDRNWDDQDGDGASTCDDPADCADEDPLIGPEVPPACGDGIDNNCDGYGDCRLQGELDPATLSAGAVLSGWGAASGGLDVRDVDADGVADLLLWSSSVAILHGPLLDVRSTDDAVATLDLSMNPRPKLGDLTNDGMGDLVYSQTGLADPTVYTIVPGPLVGVLDPWSNGIEVRISAVPDVSGEISLVDATNDGAVDLVVGHGSTVADANGSWYGCLYIVPGPITVPKDATDVWHRSCHATPGAGLAEDFDVIENWDGTGIATVASLAPGLQVGLHDGAVPIDGAVYLLQPQPGEFDVDLAADLRIIDTGVHEIDFLQAVGDTNGDGYDDLVLGEGSLYTDDATERSTIRSVLGGAAGLVGEVDLVSSPDHLVHWYSQAIPGTAGDVDGNGTDDVLLHVYSSGVSSTVLVYTPIQGAMDLDGTSAMFFGATTARKAGDINGDGMGDLYLKSEALADGDPLVTTILGVPDGF